MTHSLPVDADPVENPVTDLIHAVVYGKAVVAIFVLVNVAAFAKKNALCERKER